jgi:RNA polymerase sigma-70 factor (ECF subfamily)
MRMNALALTNAKPINRQALVGIYQEYSPALYRYAYRLLGDQDQAEECVAETFSRFLQIIRRGGGPSGSIKAYLFRIAHNWITDYYRRQPPESHDLNEEIHAGITSDPERGVHQKLEKERIRIALLKLPSEQRLVIELRFLEDWSHDQIAVVMGKTVEATRAMQYRGLMTLRQLLLSQEEKEDGTPTIA